MNLGIKTKKIFFNNLEEASKRLKGYEEYFDIYVYHDIVVASLKEGESNE